MGKLGSVTADCEILPILPRANWFRTSSMKHNGDDAKYKQKGQRSSELSVVDHPGYVEGEHAACVGRVAEVDVEDDAVVLAYGYAELNSDGKETK
jgi:hypothetical protein